MEASLKFNMVAYANAIVSTADLLDTLSKSRKEITMTDQIIAQSVAEATIAAPLHSINLAEWVFTLTDSEYQVCSVHRIAAAATRTASGCQSM